MNDYPQREINFFSLNRLRVDPQIAVFLKKNPPLCNPSVFGVSLNQLFEKYIGTINILSMEQHFDIVEACKRGDRKAQFELYKLYSKAMYNICVRMLGTAENAEDALQNAFVDVFTKLESFRFESTIGAWIKRIVINNCINALKKRRVVFAELNDNTQILVTDTPSVSEGILNVSAIQSAIHQLSDGYRMVFNLYALEGYDHEEIGQVLGISEATSKSQYSRAKAKLREILKSPQSLITGG
jgi:RNA polymerase sigma factor (sigma-70 family)